MNEPAATPNSPEPVPPTEGTESGTNPNPSLVTEGKPSEGEPEPGAAEPKPGEEPKEPEAPAEPLTAADITFPDGVEVNEELRDEFLSVVNNRELSPKEQAQALVDLQLKAAQAASEAGSNAWTEMQTKWKDEVKADPEVGGEKLQPALGRIGRLIDEYGSKELTATFDLTGAGNNVHVIKFLDKLAAKLTEPGPVSGAPANAEVDKAARLFPSMKG